MILSNYPKFVRRNNTINPQSGRESAAGLFDSFVFCYSRSSEKFVVQRNSPESQPERTLWPIRVPPYPSSLLLPALKGPFGCTLEHVFALFLAQGSI